MARKPNGMFYTEAEQQHHARHLRRRQARAESQRLAKENGEVNYVLDWKSVRELSCVNTLEHFIAYNKTQCEYYGMAAPLSTTPEHLREVPGYLSININDEQLVLHGVWYCKSYTDNVIVVAHLVVATNWWIDRLSGFLVGPTVGTKYHLTEFTDAHAVGFEYAVHDQHYVWVLNVKRGVNMGTTSSNELLVTQPPLSTGVWGAATFPILGENLSVNLRLRAVASDLTTSDILAFLKTHTQPSTRELPYQTLAGFLEQPSVRTVNPQSVQDREALAVACTRPDVSLDDEEPRLWSIRHPSVWRPSPDTMAWRQNSNLDPLGCAQRARGTAILPNLNTPETFLVTAQNPDTNQSDDRINAALSGDQNAYLDNHLAEYLGLLVATRPTPLMLITEASVNGQPGTVWTITGTAKITVSRPRIRTTTYTCLVFEKGRSRGHGPPLFLPEPPIDDADISDEAMSRWVSSHLPGAWDDGMARWKLMALAHVREHWHLPTVDLLLFDTASDEDEPPDAPGYLAWKRHVTSLDRVWRYPRVPVHIASQPGPAPNPGLESTTHVNASVDIMAPFPLMSRSFALRARIDLRALDTTEAGFLFELRPGLGRMHQLGSPAHRTRYWGLGFTTVRCNFGGVSADHWVSVRIMVFEDRALDRRSCVDVIFHRTLMEELSHNLVPKMGSDPIHSRDDLPTDGHGDSAPVTNLRNSRRADRSRSTGPVDRVIPTADERPSAAGAGTEALPPTRLPSDRDAPAVHNAPFDVPPDAVSPVDVISSRAPPGGAGDPDRDDNDPDEDPDDHDPGPAVPARCHYCGLVVAFVNDSWEAHNRVCPTLLLVTSTLAEPVDEAGARSTLAGAGGASPSSPGLLGVTYEPDEMSLTAAAFQAKARASAVKPEVSPHATPFDADSPGPPAALFTPPSQSVEWQSLPAQRAMDSSSFALSPDTSLGLLSTVEPMPPPATGPTPCNLCHGTIRTPTSGAFSANDCADGAGSGPAHTPSSGSACSAVSGHNAPLPLPLPDARALADRISQGHRDSAAWQLRADKEIARSRQAAASTSNALAAVVGDLQTVNASAATTAAVLQQLLDETKQMRSETTTRANLMEDRLSIMQVATTSAIESSENTLHARLTPMVTQLLNSGMTPMVSELREANRELSESLATLTTRMDNITSSRRRDSHEERLLDVVLDNTRAQIAPALHNSSTTGAAAAASRPAPVPHRTVEPGAASEPGTTENEFHYAPLTEVQRLRASESNLQHELDMANARAHSVIGAGSTHCHTGVATPILFTGSSKAASYITTAFQGGRPTTSDVGKPWEDKNGIRKFTGANRGVFDNAATGVCAINFLSSVVAFHSTKRHDNAELLGRAMRSTVLTHLADARNPALLWNWILTLNSEALALTVAPSTTKLLVGDTKQPFMTDGHVLTSIPLAAAKSLDRQAGAYNLMIETNKINHIAERSSPVRKDVMDFCLAAGNTREVIEFRHVNGQCYYCGEDVRKGGNIVHTYLNCEKRLTNEPMIRAKMEASFRSDGPTASHASQRLANERQTTSGDTTATDTAGPTTEATTTTALAEKHDADTLPAATSHGRLTTAVTATTTPVIFNATNDRATAPRPRTNGVPTNEATVLPRAKETPHGKTTARFEEKVNHLLTAPPPAANDLDDDASQFSDHESPAFEDATSEPDDRDSCSPGNGV
ncbi:hypothetical protein T484DRAFT_1829447 [Baffinella frigidus]|nr:hypothetical protein T484DRAFT_1829447 [Cryptophyta sp. CCMP2293]